MVFDCMIYLQAAAAPHRSHPCFGAVLAGRCELCLSAPTLAEVRAVLHRPALRQKFRLLTQAGVDDFLANVKATATFLEQVPAVFQLPRDPKDEKWIDLSISAGASYLVTRDKDLLDLNLSSPEGTALAELAPSLKVLEPCPFLEAIASGQGP